MDTQSLQTFLLLSKLKNFSLTAEKLFVAQSTVTNRIASLEKILGRQLFIRDKKNVELTGEGILFVNYAARILELEKNAVQEMNQLCFYKNSLRIGCTYTIYECHLYPILFSFLKSSNDTCVKVISGHSDELLEMLEAGLIDIAFSYLNYIKSGYKCIPFISDELVLVTSPKNRSFINGIYENDLLKINYLMCDLALQETGRRIRKLFPPYFQFSFEIDNCTKVLKYLTDGFGYSFLPKSMIENLLDNKTLISIPLIDFKAPELKSYFIYKSNSRQLGEFFRISGLDKYIEKSM